MSRENSYLSSGLREVDIEFQTLEEPFVEPPNPYFLRVHAAFAKVLCLSGISEYIPEE